MKRLKNYMAISSNMANALRMLCLSLLLAGCSPRLHETLVDTASGETVGGYCTGCPLSLTKNLHKKDFSDEIVLSWGRKNVDLFFTLDSVQRFSFIEVGDEARIIRTYRTSRGLTPGDSLNQVLKLYGKPKVKKEVYWEIGNQSYFLCKLWAYHNFMVYANENEIVTGFGVGINPYFKNERNSR